MIKNWTVKTKQIKKKNRVKRKGKADKVIKSSAFKYASYLLNQNAKSHYSTNIVDLNDSPKRLVEIEKQFLNRKIYRQANGLRGGGINCEATSFVLSLPKDVKQPTHSEWRKIAARVIRSLESTTGISAKDLWNQSVIVLHEEPSDAKNNHLNIMIGNVHDNEFCKALTQHKSTYAVKKTFNEEMMRLGVDHKKYTPNKTKTRDKPLYIARAEKLKEQEEIIKIKNNDLNHKRTNLDILKQEVEYLIESFKNWIKSFKDNDYDMAVEYAECIEEAAYTVEEENFEILEKITETAEIIEDEESAKREVREEEKVSTRTRRRRRRTK